MCLRPLRSLLEDEGIYIVLNTRIKRVSGKSGDSVRIVVEQNGVESTLEGSHVLVATRPHSRIRRDSVWSWPASK